MKRRVKVIGAGSIGTHLTQASRRMGWDVTVVDRDSEALRRMREDLYPSRYGAWDTKIKQYVSDAAERGGFDVIFIGTPPDIRLQVAEEVLAEQPKLLQLEKPLACPSEVESLTRFAGKARREGVKLVSGYDHTVSVAVKAAVQLIRGGGFGKLVTIDVEFREHFEGIFKAHPWLSGPSASYLGFWKRGGGASGECSHAANLWQYLAEVAGAGEVDYVSAMLDYVNDGSVNYDRLCVMNLETEIGLVGRVVQDVVTKPARKMARLQYSEGFIEVTINGRPEGDLMVWAKGDEKLTEQVFPKDRADDFFQEIKEIDAILEGEVRVMDSPLSVERAIKTLEIIQAAHRSNAVSRSVGL